MKTTKELIKEIESGKNPVDVIEEWEKSLTLWDRFGMWLVGFRWVNSLMRRLTKWVAEYEREHGISQNH